MRNRFCVIELQLNMYDRSVFIFADNCVRDSLIVLSYQIYIESLIRHLNCQLPFKSWWWRYTNWSSAVSFHFNDSYFWLENLTFWKIFNCFIFRNGSSVEEVIKITFDCHYKRLALIRWIAVCIAHKDFMLFYFFNFHWVKLKSIG